MLQIPLKLRDLGSCLTAAANVVAASAEEALGFGTKGARPRQAQAALKDLEEQQKARAKRVQRDALDRALTELTGFYRDLLAVQTGSGAELINADLGPQIATLARRSTPEATLRKIQALLDCRTALEGNVAALLAVEAMLISLL